MKITEYLHAAELLPADTFKGFVHSEVKQHQPTQEWIDKYKEDAELLNKRNQDYQIVAVYFPSNPEIGWRHPCREKIHVKGPHSLELVKMMEKYTHYYSVIEHLVIVV